MLILSIIIVKVFVLYLDIVPGQQSIDLKPTQCLMLWDRLSMSTDSWILCLQGPNRPSVYV